MKTNVEAIKDAIERRVIIAGLIVDGAVKLEEFGKSRERWYNMPRPLTVSETRWVGKLEDAQQELPDESEKLQSYVDKLLDPEAAWPDEPEWIIPHLCKAERDNIARFCDPKIRKVSMPN